MNVLIYVDTSKEVGDKNHLKVFADQRAAEEWFAQHDPEGIAFEYEVIGPAPLPNAGFQTHVGQPRKR